MKQQENHSLPRIKKEVLRPGQEQLTRSKSKGRRRFTGSIVRVCLDEKGLY
ncbi:hypothetical protein [Belliella aquatica]|uniref:hypothetical protein n=1 Tax=Belliella aquatica TaxID=1323734 RepID=UPI001662CC4D|nr:hypothetical protein [Belliella aquatica]MCH7407650.1 hypothetical protein [Belliella aquatica]